MRLLFSLLLSFFSLNALAQPLSQLDELRQRVSTLKKEQNEIEQQLREAEQELAGLRKETQRLEIEQSEAQTSLLKLRQDTRALQGNFDLLAEQIATMEAYAMARARSAYMLARQNLTGVALTSENRANAGRILYYYGKVDQYDRALRAEREEAGRRQSEALQALKPLIEQTELLQGSLAEKKQTYAAKVAKQEQVTRGIRRNQEKQAKLIKELQAQALRLESILTAVTGGAATRALAASDSLSRDQAPDQPVSLGFSGDGLKTGLDSPCAGKLKGRFGEKEALSGLPRKGLEFTVANDSSAIAVADGKVIFAGEAPGYGNLVILDHGLRMYSLYGQLGDVLVQKDSIVRSGAAVGATPGRCYFEVRVQGKAVNPQRYLR